MKNQLKEKLIGEPGKRFVAVLTHQTYAWSKKISAKYFEYHIFEHVDIRDTPEVIEKHGLNYSPEYHFDCVLFIKPGFRGLKLRQIISVSILFMDKQDLISNEDMSRYLGYTDYFFIGVPSDLVNDAKERTHGSSRIGVFCVDDGAIIVMPKRLKPDIYRKADLSEVILFDKMLNADFKDKVLFEMGDVTPNQDLSNFILKKGLTPSDQRVFEVIRKSKGIQAKDILKLQPDMGVSTIKRSISHLTNACLIERIGSRKTGKYFIKRG